MSRERRSIKPGRTVLAVLSVLASVCVLLVFVGCENLTATSPTVSSAGDTVLSSTTQSVAEPSAQSTTTEPSAQSTTTESSAAVAETVTSNRAPDVLLDEGDFGRQVRLHLGDRVRVDLPAHPTEKGQVTSVEWTYSTGGIVQQIGAGTNTTGGFVTACWLELEAIAPGDVTIRTIYTHEDTTTRAKWVVYLAVE
jgi:hypothetical protein